MEIIKFTQSYAYAGQIGYIIPGKSDFSEMIYVVVWNLDPLFENVLSTFRFLDVPQDEGLDKIILLSPNGGEAWNVGNTYDIKWRVEIVAGPRKRVVIFLVNTE